MEAERLAELVEAGGDLRLLADAVVGVRGREEAKVAARGAPGGQHGVERSALSGLGARRQHRQLMLRLLQLRLLAGTIANRSVLVLEDRELQAGHLIALDLHGGRHPPLARLGLCEARGLERDLGPVARHLSEHVTLLLAIRRI